MLDRWWGGFVAGILFVMISAIVGWYAQPEYIFKLDKTPKDITINAEAPPLEGPSHSYYPPVP